jgi:hypothetical protein
MGSGEPRAGERDHRLPFEAIDGPPYQPRAGRTRILAGAAIAIRWSGFCSWDQHGKAATTIISTSIPGRQNSVVRQARTRIRVGRTTPR